MKNLTKFFGLLVALALFTFTACQPDQLTEQDEITLSELQIQEAAANQELPPFEYREYFLPLGMDKLSSEEIAAYKATMTNETLDLLVEQTRIADYLGSIGLIKQVTDRMSQGEILTLDIAENFLSEQQMSALATYDGTASTTARGCTAWQFAGCNDVYNSCCFPLCYVNWTCEENRSCDWWEVFAARWRTTSKGPTHSCH